MTQFAAFLKGTNHSGAFSEIYAKTMWRNLGQIRRSDCPTVRAPVMTGTLPDESGESFQEKSEYIFGPGRQEKFRMQVKCPTCQPTKPVEHHLQPQSAGFWNVLQLSIYSRYFSKDGVPRWFKDVAISRRKNDVLIPNFDKQRLNWLQTSPLCHSAASGTTGRTTGLDVGSPAWTKSALRTAANFDKSHLVPAFPAISYGVAICYFNCAFSMELLSKTLRQAIQIQMIQNTQPQALLSRYMKLIQAGNTTTPVFHHDISSLFGITTSWPKNQGCSQKLPPDVKRLLFFHLWKVSSPCSPLPGCGAPADVWQAIPLAVSTTRQTSFPPFKGSNWNFIGFLSLLSSKVVLLLGKMLLCFVQIVSWDVSWLDAHLCLGCQVHICLLFEQQFDLTVNDVIRVHQPVLCQSHLFLWSLFHCSAPSFCKGFRSSGSAAWVTILRSGVEVQAGNVYGREHAPCEQHVKT